MQILLFFLKRLNLVVSGFNTFTHALQRCALNVSLSHPHDPGDDVSAVVTDWMTQTTKPQTLIIHELPTAILEGGKKKICLQLYS